MIADRSACDSRPLQPVTRRAYQAILRLTRLAGALLLTGAGAGTRSTGSYCAAGSGFGNCVRWRGIDEQGSRYIACQRTRLAALLVS